MAEEVGSRTAAVLVMHYVEGWISGDYPEAARYLHEHIEEILYLMVEDGCALPDEVSGQ